jgi:hypothetical protein
MGTEDKDDKGKGSGLPMGKLEDALVRFENTGLAGPVLASPMEKLEDTLVRFETMCLNGTGQHFRNRLKARVGTRLHTMLARLGSLS